MNENHSSYKWLILAIGIVITLGSLGFGRFGFTMILPGMKNALQLSDTQAGLLVTASLIGYLLLSITCGFIVSKYGFRFTITFFLALAGVSALCLGLSRNYPAAIVSSLFLGIGSAGSNIPLLSLLALWFSKRRRGMAVGLSTSGSSLGLLLTGLIIPFFYRIRMGDGDGWSYSWYFLAGLICIIAVLAGIFLREAPESSDKTGGNGETGQNVKIKQIYRVKILWHLGLIYLMFGLSYIIYATFFTSYLVSEVGFTINRAGALWSTIGVISIGSGFLWGAFSDKAGRKYALAMVFLLQCLCYGVFGIWKSVPGALLSALFFSLTSWSIPAIMAAAVGDLFESRIGPLAFGFITLFFGIGQAAGPVVAGAIADVSGTYSFTFVAAAVFAFMGIAGSLLLPAELKHEFTN